MNVTCAKPELRLNPLLIYIMLIACCIPPLQAANMAPKNPYLADSTNAMAHNDPSQQDAVPHRGPGGPSRILYSDEIEYNHVGPAHFGTLTSGIYADGRRVFWGNGIDRIAKVDHETYEILDEYFFPGTETFTSERAEISIAEFNASNDGIRAIYRSYKEMSKLKNLANLYTLLDRDHNYYIGSKTGLITAYSDEDPQDSRSKIVKKATFQLPAEATGHMVGISMTYDGWLITITEHGYVVAFNRDFSDYRMIRVKHSEGAQNKATGPTGKGWIRNAPAIDQAGGIYIASQDHMHKVVWTGDQLSNDEKDGAWTARYLNGLGEGTGATPSLMGFGSEDQFVVITDGQELMNVVLMWRNGIPEEWVQLEDAPDRRIAGQIAANMGNPELRSIQSEQSVVVAGYGALVVNNIPRNIPWYLPNQASTLLISLLGSNPRYQPYGVQKFEWDPVAGQLKQAWVNSTISSPSCVPLVSAGSSLVYLIGARDNRWTLEALNWGSGRSRFHYVIGDQRYNVLFSGVGLDENGRIHYGTPWGRVRLSPKRR
ncbi:MAG: hypothetical protein HOC23_05230 [Halieaceae bacterium]|jgi:hypothetical protein|nr:hypothetical protein [Halieaceae bacterium]